MTEQENLQGVLCMHKPQEFTSFDVIGKLRGILHIRRLGHTGTLDPMATGVLPILVGAATKACDILPNQEKTYRAAVQFGKTTDTEDIWGNLTETYPQMHVTREKLEAVLPQFTGMIQQLPPMYSAVSVGGKRLYEMARKGMEVERPLRTVSVQEIVLEQFDEQQQTAVLSVSCGKGTYIRTLLADMGRTLGGGAVMTSLCRTTACGFSLAQCLTFAEVIEAVEQNTLAQHLIPTDALFSAMPALHLNEKLTRLYTNGVKLSLGQIPDILPPQQAYRVYGWDGAFLGTANVDAAANVLRVGKNFR